MSYANSSTGGTNSSGSKRKRMLSDPSMPSQQYQQQQLQVQPETRWNGVFSDDDCAGHHARRRQFRQSGTGSTFVTTTAGAGASVVTHSFSDPALLPTSTTTTSSQRFVFGSGQPQYQYQQYKQQQQQQQQQQQFRAPSLVSQSIPHSPAPPPSESNYSSFTQSQPQHSIPPIPAPATFSGANKRSFLWPHPPTLPIIPTAIEELPMEFQGRGGGGGPASDRRRSLDESMMLLYGGGGGGGGGLGSGSSSWSGNGSSFGEGVEGVSMNERRRSLDTSVLDTFRHLPLSFGLEDGGGTGGMIAEMSHPSLMHALETQNHQDYLRQQHAQYVTAVEGYGPLEGSIESPDGNSGMAVD